MPGQSSDLTATSKRIPSQSFFCSEYFACFLLFCNFFQSSSSFYIFLRWHSQDSVLFQNILVLGIVHTSFHSETEHSPQYEIRKALIDMGKILFWRILLLCCVILPSEVMNPNFLLQVCCSVDLRLKWTMILEIGTVLGQKSCLCMLGGVLLVDWFNSILIIFAILLFAIAQ